MHSHHFKKTLSCRYFPLCYLHDLFNCLSIFQSDLISKCLIGNSFWANLLEYNSSLTGNSFTNRAKVTPRHEAFVNKILQSNAHFICTIRSKTDYVLSVHEKIQINIDTEELKVETSLEEYTDQFVIPYELHQE